MRFLPVLVLTLLTFIGVVSSVAQTTPDETAALESETQWLRLVDAGDYADAWKNAARIMQEAAPEPAFAKAMAGARTPLGALAARTLKQVQTTKHLPGVPDGLYVVAIYNARFANKADGVETIVASQKPDGSWHVSGYFIR